MKTELKKIQEISVETKSQFLCWKLKLNALILLPNKKTIVFHGQNYNKEIHRLVRATLYWHNTIGSSFVENGQTCDLCFIFWHFAKSDAAHWTMFNINTRWLEMWMSADALKGVFLSYFNYYELFKQLYVTPNDRKMVWFSIFQKRIYVKITHYLI